MQGILISVGARFVVPRALELAAETETGRSDTLRFALFELAQEIRELERRAAQVEQRLAALDDQRTYLIVRTSGSSDLTEVPTREWPGNAPSAQP